MTEREERGEDDSVESRTIVCTALPSVRIDADGMMLCSADTRMDRNGCNHEMSFADIENCLTDSHRSLRLPCAISAMHQAGNDGRGHLAG